jgi:ABC-2 type transport system ATP-binding protein
MTVQEPVPALNALTAWAMANEVPLAGLTVHRPSLEDIYLRLTAENTGGSR